jgi:molybdate transport system permease protein
MDQTATSIDWFPLWLSLKVAFLATVLSLAVGLSVSYLLARHRFRGRETLDALITLPIVLPPTVLGYYLLVLLGRNTILGSMFERIFGAPLVFTWQAAVLAAMLHSIPLLVKSSRAALEGVDRSLENAARTLGASESRVFFRITLPLARRSILAATAFAFARALGDFGVTIMIAGNIPGRTQTIAVAIYDAVQSGRSGPALTMVLIISAITLAILYLTNRLQGEPNH